MNISDFKPFTFPGGERHFQIDDINDIINRSWSDGFLRAPITSSDDIMDLMLVSGFLIRNHCAPNTLYLPYVPYARQDRPTTAGSPFSMKMMAAIINMLGFMEVKVYEPHSDVASGLINMCTSVGCEGACVRAAESIIETQKYGTLQLVAPDAGATKRTERCLNQIKTGTVGWVAEAIHRTTVQCLKYRDPTTGRLKLDGAFGARFGGDFLVVDDICDGGATFIELAKHLKDDLDANSIHLFVAHGIFSKGFDVLFDAGIDTIHYTDSRDKVPLQATEVSPCGRIYKYACGL